MSGTEVDRIERPGAAWQHVWVGRIAALEKHPNADKLVLATVEYGEGRTKTVVTGATNLRVDDVVPYAEVGARLREGHGDGEFTLEPKKMRGIPSEGMVCSERELGLGEDHEGILILDRSLPIGVPLAEILGDAVLALELQPNRPDCLGVLGIARELAALLRAELREPRLAKLRYDLDPALLTVRIEDPRACRRFGAAYLEDVRIGPSPKWMQDRLSAAGMRPIDNAVDITNYVMLELGQPLHAYDAARLRGRTLIARAARGGETLRTLDGVERMLTGGTLVIADAERALGIAGILGGEDSEIRADTTAIALECASFEPRGIGRTATSLGLHGSSGSAAARRFAWELSPDLVPIALARAIALLREHAGARLGGVVDRYPRPRPRIEVQMRFADVRRIFGIDIERQQVVDVLERLGFTCAADGDALVARPPVVRTDIGIAEDIVEEVGRIVGYDRLPPRIPDGALPLAEPHPPEAFPERLRDALVAMGLQETGSYSLIDPGWLCPLTADGAPIAPEPLRVTNPTTHAQSVARPTIRPSLLDIARRNIRHRGGLGVFEIAPAYLPRRADLPEERWTAAILLSGEAAPQSWLGAKRDVDLWDLKAILSGVLDRLRIPQAGTGETAPGLHPGRSERRMIDGRPAITWGQLDPRVAEVWEIPAATFVAELDVAALLALAEPVRATPPSRYPPAIRDVAVVVDDATPYAAVERAVHAAGKDLVESVALLDLYRGPQVGTGKKSFAVRLVLRSEAGTLTDADVDRVQKRLEGRLLHELGATIRS